MQARYGEEEEELVEIYWRERKRRFRQVERRKEGKETGEEVCATKKKHKKCHSSKSASFAARTVFKLGEQET